MTTSTRKNLRFSLQSSRSRSALSSDMGAPGARAAPCRSAQGAETTSQFAEYNGEAVDELEAAGDDLVGGQ